MTTAEDEIDLKEYVRVLKRNKWVILLVIFLVTLLSIVVSLLLPKKYSASAVLMPSGGSKSGGLGAAAAIGAQLGLGGMGSSTSTQLMALLTSRSLTERVIFKNDLLPFIFSKEWNSNQHSWKKENPEKSPQKIEIAVETVSRGIIKFNDDKKNQTISIQAITESPEMSAKIVNAYVVELANFIKENTFTTSKQNRIFIEEQLARNRAELLKAGTELSGFYRENRALTSEPTVDVDVTKDLLTLQPTESVNPSTQIVEVEGQIDNLNKKLKEIGVVQKVPQQVYLQYLTLRRDLLGQVNTLLTQQYEMAKIEETKEDLNFQVIDWARVPIQRHSPKRGQIVIMSFIASVFLSFFIALIKESKILDELRG